MYNLSNQEAVNAIKSNYPPENYVLLREALDLAISSLKEDDEDIKKQRDEIFVLEYTIKSMRSEIMHTLRNNKSSSTKKEYLKNAVRYADDAIYVE